MVYELSLAPGITFKTTASSLGLSDRSVLRMRQNQESALVINFVWATMRDASEQLLEIPYEVVH